MAKLLRHERIAVTRVHTRSSLHTPDTLDRIPMTSAQARPTSAPHHHSHSYFSPPARIDSQLSPAIFAVFSRKILGHKRTRKEHDGPVHYRDCTKTRRKIYLIFQ